MKSSITSEDIEREFVKLPSGKYAKRARTPVEATNAAPREKIPESKHSLRGGEICSPKSENMTRVLAFTVDGNPVGKARARVVDGHAFTPKKSKDYENRVQVAIMASGGRLYFDEGVSVSIYIYHPRPNSHFNKRGLKATAPTLPLCKPDLDNVVKSILDAMNGLVYNDDKQIITLHVQKYYSDKSEGYVKVQVGEEAHNPPSAK